MPYAPETKSYARSGTSRKGEHDQLLDLFTFQTVYMMGELVQTAMDSSRTRGRRGTYPATLLFGLLCGARTYTSVPRVLRVLEIESIWREIGERYFAVTGDRLPLRPPNKDTLDHFKTRLLKLEADPPFAGSPSLLFALQELFRRCALGQAQDHGNLLPGQVCDWTRPQQYNAIEGDGTTVKPFSKVRLVPDPWHPGDVIPVGSRAKNPERARVQDFHSDMTEDGKNTRGLNMVSVQTWTPWGRVVLGTATALRAEQWAALELIEAVARRAGGGLHTVIWDKAITGWNLDHLMSTFGAQVLGKSVAHGEDKAQKGRAGGQPGTEDPGTVGNATPGSAAAAGGYGTRYSMLSDRQRAAKERAKKKAAKDEAEKAERAEGSAVNGRIDLHERYLQKRAERQAAELQAPPLPDVLRILRSDHLATLYHGSRPLPVGTSIYERENGYEPVYGKTYYLEPVTHHTADGPCTHELVVDDGSLYVVGYDPVEEYPVKEHCRQRSNLGPI